MGHIFSSLGEIIQWIVQNINADELELNDTEKLWLMVLKGVSAWLRGEDFKLLFVDISQIWENDCW